MLPTLQPETTIRLDFSPRGGYLDARDYAARVIEYADLDQVLGSLISAPERLRRNGRARSAASA